VLEKLEGKKKRYETIAQEALARLDALPELRSAEAAMQRM
jgi:hypothetical protein